MIKKIQQITGQAIPLKGNDIDTDRIIPARFMKCLTFDGLGQFAFYDVRFNDKGEEKDHPLNSPDYAGHSILITNRNFGCGSSREHAPWALSGIGITCIIAESYAEIFANNCSSLGIPALIVDEETVTKLQNKVSAFPEAEIKIDLLTGTLSLGEENFTFDMPETYRKALIEGKWDTTSMLMENLNLIEKKHSQIETFNRS